MEGIYHENPEERFNRLCFVGIGISSVPFFWEWPVLVGVAGSGSRRMWLHRVQVFQAPVIFCSVGCCELEERQQKGLKRSHAFGGKKESASNTEVIFDGHKM